MATSWPEPPPLFDVDDAHAGERGTWLPRSAPRSARRRPDPALAGRVELELFAELEAQVDVLVADVADVSDESPGWPHRVGVFDLETTGVDVRSDRVVTAYVGLLDGSGAVVSESRWMADPGIEIPVGAAAVHGITTERARAEGRPAGDVVAEIVAELGALLSDGIPVVAYNAPFDFSLLRHEALRHGVAPLHAPWPVIDPLVLDKGLDRFRKGKRTLETVAAHYGVALDDAHEASADAIAAGRLALAMTTRHAERLPDELDALHSQQIEWAREQAAGLTEYFVRIGRIPATETIDGSWPVR